MIDYAKIKADKPLKLQREWVGRLVRLREELRTNGGTVFPAGLVMQVEGKYHGLTLKVPFTCPCCGVGTGYSITGVHPSALDLLPRGTPVPEPLGKRPNPKPHHDNREPVAEA